MDVALWLHLGICKLPPGLWSTQVTGVLFVIDLKALWFVSTPLSSDRINTTANDLFGCVDYWQIALPTLFNEGFVLCNCQHTVCVFFWAIVFGKLAHSDSFEPCWPFVTFLIGWVGGNAATRNTAQLWVCQLWPELAITFHIVRAIDLHWVRWEILRPNCFLIALHLARQQTFVLLPSYFQSRRLASSKAVVHLTIDLKIKWWMFNYMYV